MRWVGAVLVLLAVAAVAFIGSAFWLVLRPSAPVASAPPTLSDAAQTKPPEPASPEPAPPEPRKSASPPAAEAPAAGSSNPLGRGAAPDQTASPAPAAVSSSGLRLELPVACDPGVDCWVLNYVDIDPGPGRRDFACGELSYDGHKGTDFALRNESRLADDVPVLAAAGGRVLGVRDGMDDVNVQEIGRDAVKGRECGNGVRIAHADGWATQYCHLKRDSILVRADQQVEAGQVLGAIGMSGMAEFPHVHLQVSRNGETIDPFVGVDGGSECTLGTAPLWAPDALSRLAYRSPILLDAGLAPGPVTSREAATGTASHRRIATDSEALVLWVRLIGIEKGDRLDVSIVGPEGQPVYRKATEFDRDRFLRFHYEGRRTPDGGWPAGAYEARVRLERPGGTAQDLSVRTEVAP